jgi:CTP:molybdopterin cytidylyltransferase MocA
VKPALVILAAGASTRLGTCKALVSITPRCALELLLENGDGLDDVPPLVVTGKDHDAIVRALDGMRFISSTRTKSPSHHDVEEWTGMSVEGRCQAPISGVPPTGAGHPAPVVVRNPQWESGRAGSVALAATIRRGMDLCLAPVDVPLVDRSVFAALTQAWHLRGAPERGWLAPRAREKFGHPIIVGRGLAGDVAEQFARSGADTPLRAWRERADPVFSIDVEDAAVLDDLDGPDDLRTLRLRFSH